MDLDPEAMHALVAGTGVLLGVLGPVLALLYAIRVDHRDYWRTPMLVGGCLTAAAVIGVQLSSHYLLDVPRELSGRELLIHLQYADRLVLPAAGFLVVVILTATLHPRAGVLRTLLPTLLAGFATVVLVLVVLSSDDNARLVLEQVQQAI